MHPKTSPRIALISPQVIGAEHQVRKAQPPLGIAYLAAVLESGGHKGNVICIDAVVEDYDHVVPLEDDVKFIKFGLAPQKIVERLEEFNPTIVGITSLFSSMTECPFETTAIIKQAFPHVPIVMGGNHASNTAEWIISNIREIDYVIKGESEFSFLDFVDKYSRNMTITDVPGLVYRTDKKIKSNPSRPFNSNLDKLPDPAFHLFPMERYFEIGMPHNPFVKSGRVGSIMTSRGCPEHCYFCTSPDFTGTAFRAMTPERVILQIRRLVDLYNIKELQILDDNFTVSYKRVIDICHGISNLGLRITLPNSIRADMPINRKKRADMYRAMRECGVAQLGISVEHGDQEFLNSITKKRLDLDEVRATCDLAHEAGILVHAAFMIGFPFETKELRQKTREYSKTLDADSFSVSLTQPLPGTPLWKIVEDHDLFMPDFKVNRMTFGNVSIKPHDISSEELKEEAESLNRELNRLGAGRREKTKEKYARFSSDGKSADGDRKYSISIDDPSPKWTLGVGELLHAGEDSNH